MDSVERIKLEASLKELALSGLNALIEHNVRGADLIKKGVEAVILASEEFEDHYEELKRILQMLKPIFEVAREWISKCYAHLLSLFDWAKERWHDIFG